MKRNNNNNNNARDKIKTIMVEKKNIPYINNNPKINKRYAVDVELMGDVVKTIYFDGTWCG